LNMGNCATNCNTCVGGGEVGEYKMADQYEDIRGNAKSGNETDFGNRQFQDGKDYNKLLQDKMKFIIKLQAFWRGHTARRLIGLLRAKQLGSSKYFTQEEARETISNRRFYDPDQPREQRQPYQFKTGAVYTGQWKGGFRDGFGEQTWPDGAKYAGEWRENRAHGKGRFIHVDGDIYDGYWANDKANGRGVYKHVNGAQYEGLWKDDLQHGYGVETWTDKSKYEGDYAFGRKHGIGSYQWNDGSMYTGDWRENKISGIGVYSWLDGRRYQGEWLDNNMEGMGIYIWNDGRMYQGQYKDDKKHGFGVYTWADRRSYEGYWYKGKQHGIGTYVVPKDNKVKFGLWEDGKRIEWFNETQVQAINNLQLNYTTFFHQTESETMVEPDATFKKPKGFDDRLGEVGRRIEELNMRAKSISNSTGWPNN